MNKQIMSLFAVSSLLITMLPAPFTMTLSYMHPSGGSSSCNTKKSLLTARCTYIEHLLGKNNSIGFNEAVY